MGLPSTQSRALQRPARFRVGYNVYPREIEEVIYEHPAVSEAADVGIPHAELGEEVGAAVVLKEGEEVSEDELRN